MDLNVLPSGQQVLTPTGGARLLVLGHVGQEVIFLDVEDDLVLLRRHWDPVSHTTEPCLCEPRCSTSRVDRCLGGVVRLGSELWEHVLVVVSEEGWASMERQSVAVLGKWRGTRGLRVVMRRAGGKSNGRVSVSVQDFHPMVETLPVDVLASVRRILKVSADFFGRGADEDQPDVDDRVIPPARLRPTGNGRPSKPRLAKGTPTKG